MIDADLHRFYQNKTHISYRSNADLVECGDEYRPLLFHMPTEEHKG